MSDSLLESISQSAPELSSSQSENIEQVNSSEISDEVKIEQKVEEVKKPEEKKEPDLLSKRFAALSRQEKMLKAEKAELAKKQRDLEERIKALEPKQEKIVEPSFEDLFERNPLEAMKKKGVSFDKLTQLVLNDGKLDPESQIQLLKKEIESKYDNELKRIREEQEQKERVMREEREKEVIENFKYSIKEYIDSNPDKYKLIEANDAHDMVWELIDGHFKEHGRVLSSKEAADFVESELREQAQRMWSLLNPEPQKKDDKRVEPLKEGVKSTLTNDMASHTSKPTDEPIDEASLQKLAASMLRWQD